jgi:hypothetical protein
VLYFPHANNESARDMAELATETVLKQAEMIADELTETF